MTIHGMSKNTKSDSYNTPDYIFKQLNDIYTFTLDAACSEENCKCIRQQTHFKRHDKWKDWNGLTHCWSKERVFCNPPFSQKEAWVKKAHEEVQGWGCPIVVMILPLNSISNKNIHGILFQYEVEILKNRISFLTDETKEPIKGNSTGTAIVYFRKRIKV